MILRVVASVLIAATGFAVSASPPRSIAETQALDGVQRIVGRSSKDDGETWAAGKPAFSMPREAAGAVWNFSLAARGRMVLKLMLKPGFSGALLGLTDHFSVPFDAEDRFFNLFNLETEVNR